MSASVERPGKRPSKRDLLWVQSRNALGIARLLAQERRADEMVATACDLAVDAACRAALAHAGLSFEGDYASALRRLDAPEGLWVEDPRTVRDRLAAAERVVTWTASYLRSDVPREAWTF
jgi:hypothetical protein